MRKIFIGVDLHKHQIAAFYLSEGLETIEVYYFSNNGINLFIKELKLLKGRGTIPLTEIQVYRETLLVHDFMIKILSFTLR